MLDANDNQITNEKQEFIIDEDGILTKYEGPGGDVVIPDGVRDIFFDAFYGSSEINSIVIPGTISEISSFLFESSNIRIVKISEGVTTIGVCSFNSSEGLVAVFIPKSVKYIGSFAFANCTSLQRIYYGGSEEDWLDIDKDGDWDEGSVSYDIAFNFSDAH